mmetsp:Transcript_15682/g.39739  ORF Transcript_15682/g.39739 Transcript_15682/m.39739 type:complete len:240 (+) Transcript_15682:420-1139(+)
MDVRYEQAELPHRLEIRAAEPRIACSWIESGRHITRWIGRTPVSSSHARITWRIQRHKTIVISVVIGKCFDEVLVPGILRRADHQVAKFGFRCAHFAHDKQHPTRGWRLHAPCNLQHAPRVSAYASVADIVTTQRENDCEQAVHDATVLPTSMRRRVTRSREKLVDESVKAIGCRASCIQELVHNRGDLHGSLEARNVRELEEPRKVAFDELVASVCVDVRECATYASEQSAKEARIHR